LAHYRRGFLIRSLRLIQVKFRLPLDTTDCRCGLQDA
jgi:hypothetical protein